MGESLNRNDWYEGYLKSAAWQRRRLEALKRATYQCAVCLETTSLEVHHKTYERIGHERPEDLVVLCARHHLAVTAAGMPQFPFAVADAISAVEKAARECIATWIPMAWVMVSVGLRMPDVTMLLAAERMLGDLQLLLHARKALATSSSERLALTMLASEALLNAQIERPYLPDWSEETTLYIAECSAARRLSVD